MPKLGMEVIRRRQVIDAVLRILSENGWRELKIREVGEVAGVSSGIIAHYFGKKREMTVDAIAEAHRRFEQRMAEIEQAYDHPLECLVAYVDLPAGFEGRELPGWAFWQAIWGQVPFDRVLRAEAAHLHEAVRQRIARAIHRGVELRLFAARADAGAVADTLIALSRGLGNLHLLDERGMPPKRVRQTLLQTLGLQLGVDFGVRAQPPAPEARSGRTA